jgi:hypothetical protein
MPDIPSTAPGAPADAGTGGQAPTGTQPPAATPPVQTGQQPGPGAQPPATGQPQDISSLPDWAQRIITETRAEAAQHRTAKQTATQEAQAAKTQRDQVLKAMGLNPDGTDAPATTEALTAQVEQQQAVAWTAAVELNVFRTAQAAGANGEALLDSRAFVDSLDAFTEDDPQSPDFRTKLEAHIKAYVEQHPTFKANATTTTAPPRAGGDRPAGGSGTQPQRPQGLGAAIKAHYGQRGS